MRSNIKIIKNAFHTYFITPLSSIGTKSINHPHPRPPEPKVTSSPKDFPTLFSLFHNTSMFEISLHLVFHHVLVLGQCMFHFYFNKRVFFCMDVSFIAIISVFECSLFNSHFGILSHNTENEIQIIHI